MTADAPDAPHYKVLRALGAGGFGTVYHARFVGEGGFSKEVALKVLNPELQDLADVAERLRDEARMLGLLRHRAIVQVDRLTRLEGTWAVAMEYIEGADLQQLLRLGPVPLAPALEILAEVAGALNVAWRTPGPDGAPLCLLHRDLKPANLRVTPFGEVKVLDFGIAKAEFDGREALTRSTRYGTPLYMSPERQLGEGGPKDDVYALGVMFYEMLSGRRYGQTSPEREEHEVLQQQRLAKVEEALTPEARALLLRLLAYDPAARPTAEALEREALALRAATDGEALRYWAEQKVPRAAAQATAPEGPGSLSQATLFVQSEGRSASREAKDAAGARPLIWVAGGGAALLVALLLAFGGGGGPEGPASTGGEPPPTAVSSASTSASGLSSASEPTSGSEGAPAAGAPAGPSPAPEAPSPSASPPSPAHASAAPAGATSPSEAPPTSGEPAPPEAAEPADPAGLAAEQAPDDVEPIEVTENRPAPTATLRLVDLNGSSPSLILDGAPSSGGPIAPGEHRYEVRFSTGRVTRSQTFTVAPGTQHELRCTSVGPMCVHKQVE